MDNQKARHELDSLIRTEDLSLGGMRSLRAIQDWLRGEGSKTPQLQPGETLKVPVELNQVLREVQAERTRQDQKWGGPDHDDRFQPEFWPQLIQDYAGWARVMAGMESYDKYRKRLVQVAAIAVAAAEAADRAADRAALERFIENGPSVMGEPALRQNNAPSEAGKE